MVGDREATVCRELTKKFEEIKLGKLSELSDYFLQGSVKGEFIIILSGRGTQCDEEGARI
jgi:16S rRNA (cytidine1402-2'-O)-methyltransferase